MTIGRRCSGLSYNGWLYFAPRAVLEDLIDRKMLKPCSKHPNKLLMTAALRVHVEASIWKEDVDGEASREPAGSHAAAG